MTGRIDRLTKMAAATLLTLLFVGAPASPSNAETAGLTMDPLSIEASIEPGKTTEYDIRLSNPESIRQNIAVELNNMNATGPAGDKAAFSQDDNEYSVREWIQVTPAAQVIEPGKEVTFHVKVPVPKDASPGAHLGGITFHQRSIDAQGTVKIDQAVTCLVLLKVPGNARPEFSFADFYPAKKADKKNLLGAKAKLFTDDSEDVRFVSAIKNSGNIQEKPKITVELKDIFGRKLATLKSDGTGNVLPSSTRSFTQNWHPKGYGLINAKSTVVFAGDYNATFTKSSSFFYLPVKWTLIGAGVILVVGIWVWRRRKSKGELKALRAQVAAAKKD